MNECWKQFCGALEKAAKRIGEQYFEIERRDAPPAWRERVYCYELYHQIRCILGEDNPFSYVLHGEIDKSGHRAVTDRLGKDLIPDFIVHMPGEADNLVVIEVKVGDTCSAADANADLDKLDKFINKVKYAYGIFLVFGPWEPPSNLNIRNDRIIVAGHHHPGEGLQIYHGKKVWPCD